MREDDAAEPLSIRSCGPDDNAAVLAIINAAAQSYRGVIPEDRWQDPYMPASKLASEIGDGVVLSGCVAKDRLVGVMGVQRRHNVDLIRHAYVSPEWQGRGVGSMLLRRLRRETQRPVLIGTWAAAEWAVRFYERHGFSRIAEDDAAALLRTFWDVPERQIATSVVVTSPPLDSEATGRLIAGALASGLTPA